MADVGEAWQNGYTERLIRTIKEEEVDLSEYMDYTDTLRQLGRFLDDVYLHKRIHSALGYLTPAEFEDQWRKVQALTLDVLMALDTLKSDFDWSNEKMGETCTQGGKEVLSVKGSKFSRREFLRAGSFALAATVLSSCALKAPEPALSEAEPKVEKPEMKTRAIWVQTSAIRTQELADQVLARIEAGKFTDVFQLTGSDGVNYKGSEHLPFYYGDQEFDPARYILGKYHDLGIRVHAWLCPGWCTQDATFRTAYPGWSVGDCSGVPDDVEDETKYWFAFPSDSYPLWSSVVQEVLDLGFDGVHWDYIRIKPGWSPSLHRTWYPTEIFARDQVKNFLLAMWDTLRSRPDWLDKYISAAVLSSVRDEAPDHLQFWNEWANEGLLDLALPMAYQYVGDEDELTRHAEMWAEMIDDPDIIIPGLRVDTHWHEGDLRRLKTPAELQDQIDAFAGLGFADGFCLFDETALGTFDSGDLLAYITSLSDDTPPPDKVQRYSDEVRKEHAFEVM
jgi:hypothetical protein